MLKSIVENRILEVKAKNRKFEIQRTGRKVNSGKEPPKSLGGNSEKKKQKTENIWRGSDQELQSRITQQKLGGKPNIRVILIRIYLGKNIPR